jgi:hypothetical protein
LVKAEFDLRDQLTEDLPAASRLCLGDLFAQTPQVPHGGLDLGLYVHGPPRRFGRT